MIIAKDVSPPSVMASNIASIMASLRVVSAIQVISLLVCAGFTAMAAAKEYVDPTRPIQGVVGSYVIAVEEDQAGPVLGSVLIGSERRLAIISGRRYALNDLVGEYRLVKILQRQVTLSNGIDELVLELASRQVKAEGLFSIKPFSIKQAAESIKVQER